MKGFDLTAAVEETKAEDQGAVIEIVDRLGEPVLYGTKGKEKPVTMKVVGSFSSRYRRAEEAAMRARMRSRRRNNDQTAFEFRLDIASKCVIEWDGFFEDGAPMDCTADNVRKVLAAAPWIRQQVEAAIDDHAGFTETP